MDLAAINSNLTNEKTNLLRLEQKIKDNSSEATTNTSDIAKNQKDVATNTSAQQETNHKITTLGTQISDVQSKKSGVQGEIDNLNKTLQSMNTDDADYSVNQKKLEDLKLSMADLDAMDTSYTKQKQEQEVILQTQQEEGVSLSEKGASLEKRKGELQNEADRLNSEKTQIEDNIEKLNSEKEKAETEDKNGDNEYIDKGKKSNEKNPDTFDKMIGSVENLYKNGITLDDFQVNFKKQNMNYAFGSTGANVYAGLNEVGADYSNGQWSAGGKMTYGMNYNLNAGYSNGAFSTSASYNNIDGFGARVGYNDQEGKFGVSASATQKTFDIHADYNFSNKFSMFVEGNQKGFMLGAKVNLHKS